ncbi:MAG: hypothetical protein DWQ19_09345 [Crenarchaeota archaeon]|mgnify:CR=1 FL=1|nr:MAG: hypothetical protein DWQ19_09345 [Thermoproteota archaeon]
MERIITNIGTIPAIVVVPHGYDDPNTVEIAEEIINKIDAYAVINKGWRRSDHYDYYKDEANCNNIKHIKEDVVKDEFLKPILKYKNKILNEHHLQEPAMFIIHGVSNLIRDEASDLDFIVGYGEGDPARPTAPIEFKDCFLENLKSTGLVPYQGKSGGRYSGWGRNNLNQLFNRKEFLDHCAYSLQIEIIRELREDKDVARQTGEVLSDVITNTINNWKKFKSTLTFPYI